MLDVVRCVWFFVCWLMRVVCHSACVACLVLVVLCCLGFVCVLSCVVCRLVCVHWCLLFVVFRLLYIVR